MAGFPPQLVLIAPTRRALAANEEPGTVRSVALRMSVDVQLHAVSGGAEPEVRFLKDSMLLLRQAVSSPGFGASVRNTAYGYTGWRGLTETREMTGEEIWDRIVMGRECGSTADHTLDLSVAIVEMEGIGETQLGAPPIRTARWFLEKCMQSGDRVNMAAHLMHQWMHVSGFVHSPYNIGHDAPSIVAMLVRRALESEYGEEIDAQITALLTLDTSGCNCRPAVRGLSAGDSRGAAFPMRAAHPI